MLLEGGEKEEAFTYLLPGTHVGLRAAPAGSPSGAQAIWGQGDSGMLLPCCPQLSVFPLMRMEGDHLSSELCCKGLEAALHQRMLAELWGDGKTQQPPAPLSKQGACCFHFQRGIKMSEHPRKPT